LGYVAAALAQDQCLVEFVDLDIDSSAGPAVAQFSGLYQVMLDGSGNPELHNNQPIFRNEANTALCMFNNSGIVQTLVALGDCQHRTMEYYLDDITTGTCFEGSMTDSFDVFMGNNTKIGADPLADLQSKNLGADCSECREILTGDLKGAYNLVDKHSPHCAEGTDKCVYENKDTNATVCFQKDDAGTDTLPHDTQCALDSPS